MVSNRDQNKNCAPTGPNAKKHQLSSVTCLNFTGPKAIFPSPNLKISAFGRRTGTISTPGVESSLLSICNSILRTLDTGMGVILLLLDLSAAFDTTDHDQLICTFTTISESLVNV